MAKSTYSGIPTDQPIEVEPGLMHRESEFFAQASPSRGFMQGHPTNLPGPDKGNRGHRDAGEAKPLTHDGGPFKKVRGGKE